MWELGVIGIGVISAGVTGFSAWKVTESQLRRAEHKKRVRTLSGVNSMGYGFGKTVTFDERLIDFAIAESRSLSMGHGFRVLPKELAQSSWLKEHGKAAGVEGLISERAFCEIRLRFGALGLALGALVGVMFSRELAILIGIAVGLYGLNLLPMVLKRQIRHRTNELEHHLPEMLDVVALGMRSGLSFDRSLSLYIQHFDTCLAKTFDLAQRQWMCGLERRDVALRNIAGTYESAVFGRVIEGIIRSLRFGSSMVESLESAAREVRVSYRARKQEEVAKAPVKMMVPTGALILPAMLILVVGPVLLELAGGF